uniref:SD10843p n=1 Tax=Drosophila melanogaster TaxID=7227 RepID=Q95R38_DROME|nr:SD10843p [Drosophila melanogaster]
MTGRPVHSVALGAATSVRSRRPGAAGSCPAAGTAPRSCCAGQGRYLVQRLSLLPGIRSCCFFGSPSQCTQADITCKRLADLGLGLFRGAGCLPTLIQGHFATCSVTWDAGASCYPSVIKF